MKTTIRAYRKRHKLSQSEFAAKLGISPRTLQNWETGRNEQRLRTAIRLRDISGLRFWPTQM